MNGRQGTGVTDLGSDNIIENTNIGSIWTRSMSRHGSDFKGELSRGLKGMYLIISIHGTTPDAIMKCLCQNRFKSIDHIFLGHFSLKKMIGPDLVSNNCRHEKGDHHQHNLQGQLTGRCVVRSQAVGCVDA